MKIETLSTGMICLILKTIHLRRRLVAAVLASSSRSPC